MHYMQSNTRHMHHMQSIMQYAWHAYSMWTITTYSGACFLGSKCEKASIEAEFEQINSFISGSVKPCTKKRAQGRRSSVEALICNPAGRMQGMRSMWQCEAWVWQGKYECGKCDKFEVKYFTSICTVTSPSPILLHPLPFSFIQIFFQIFRVFSTFLDRNFSISSIRGRDPNQYSDSHFEIPFYYQWSWIDKKDYVETFSDPRSPERRTVILC